MAASSPSFPKGLRVLLVDSQPSRDAIQAQLQQPELQYAVTAVGSSAEAVSYIRTGVAAFDVVLAEARLVACSESVGRSFVDAFEDTPVVLMSEAGRTSDVMRAVQLGAVDFLDKPLSLLKLKNIWQHSVRKMMAKAAGPHRSTPFACTSVSVAPVPQPAASALPPGMVLSPWASLPAPTASTAAPPRASSPSLTTAPSGAAPESPGTPSALSCDFGDFPESFSICSSGTDSGAPSMRTSMDCGESFMDAMCSALGTQPLPRPTSFSSMDSEAAAAAAAAAAPAAAPAQPAAAPPALAPAQPAPMLLPTQWPALTPGCVWGTPANGPVPPPLPGAQTAWAPLQPASRAPVLIKSNAPTLAPAPAAAPAIQPVPASSLEELTPPEGFLLSDLLAPRSGGAGGPLGLKLRKSDSLLNLINSSIAPSTHATCLFDNMGLAPMMC